jgi:hypothetical protein
VGWLFGRADSRRLRAFERAYFPVRRWHVALGERSASVSLSMHASSSSEKGSCNVPPSPTSWSLMPCSRWHICQDNISAFLPAAALLAAKAAQWAVRYWAEHTSGAWQRRKALQRAMHEAQDYDDWAAAAHQVG